MKIIHVNCGKDVKMKAIFAVMFITAKIAFIFTPFCVFDTVDEKLDTINKCKIMLCHIQCVLSLPCP